VTRIEFAKPYLVALYLMNRAHSNIAANVGEIISRFMVPRDDYLEGELVEYMTEQGWARTVGGYNDPTAQLVITPNGKIHAESFIEQGIDPFDITELDSDEALRAASILENQQSDLEKLGNQIAPASDRLILFSDNQDLSTSLITGTDEIRQIIESSNELDPIERSDVSVSLNAFRTLVEKSKSFVVGAFRYLVIERLKKAFEKTIEDALRLAIMGVLAMLTAIILAVI